ncbi:MAG: hypothetical protein PHD02_01730 [Bacilli bacterium]|nr:hypothetical protein [Bacilli bacterium]
MNGLEFFLNIILPILAIIIPVWATVYTVNKRIKAQTHENHQPHLVLEKISKIDKIDKYKYYLTFFGKNFRELNVGFNEEKAISNEDNMLNLEITLNNIGYGVATNIKFYDLLTGEQVYGSQEASLNQNQRLFTTFDIGEGEMKSVSAQLVSMVFKKDDVLEEEHNRILCVYKDLNNIVDNFILIINVKTNGHYDYFAYQPSSASYKKWIKQNKKQYKKIIDKYSKL